MFDMGFTEMMLIGIVALIVIGPERLPGVARTAGKYFGRLKRFMTTVKADVEQELRADELRQILAQQQQELNTLKDTISEAGREVGEQAGEVEKAGAELARELEETNTGTATGATRQAAAGDEPAPAADTESTDTTDTTDTRAGS